MFLPIRTDSRLRATPYVNWALIAINVVIWVAQNIVGHARGKAPWWQPYALNAGDPQLLQFITSGFLHADILHIAGNMLFLYIFGNNVNDKMGHLAYLGFYFSSLVFSGIAFAVWDKHGSAIGASGAISAVVGAYMILFPRAHVTVFVLFFYFGLYEIPSLWFILGYFVMNLYELNSHSGVAYSAHVGGTVFGAAICFLLLAVHLLPRDQFDVWALAKQWNRRRTYRDAVSGGWNPYAPGVRSSGAAFQPRGDYQAAPSPLDARQQKILELRAAISAAISNHELPAAANMYVELKVLDPQNVLPRQAQLDVANQLASEQRYAAAAEAYEMFLSNYPKYEQTAQVELMFGVILARYLGAAEKARFVLLQAAAKLTDENARNLAKSELSRLGPPSESGSGMQGATGLGGTF